MLFKSEFTGKVYKTAEDCEKADALTLKERAEEEAKKKELAETKKARANEIEELLKQRTELNKEINEKLNAFCSDYGTFHTSYVPDQWFKDFFNVWPFI